MNGYVSKATFARIYGCRPSYVTKLRGEGKLVLDEQGALVNVDASLRLIEASRDLSKAGVRERWAIYRAGGQLPAPVQVSAAGETPSPPANGSMGTAGGVEAPGTGHGAAPAAYHNARAQREAAEARLKELELRRQLGEVAEVESMRRAAADAFAATNRAARELPDRLAALVATESDPQRCWALIDAEVARLLDDLQREIVALGQRAMAGR